MLIILIFLLGASLLIHVALIKRMRQIYSDYTHLKEKSAILLVQYEHQAQKLLEYEAEKKSFTEQLHTLQAYKADSITREAILMEREKWLEHNERKLLSQFEQVANSVLQQTQATFQVNHQQTLAMQLKPFQTQLESFYSQMHQHFTLEAQERHTLTHELQKLQNLNYQLSEEANQLAKALKGQQKLQGDWGEMILAKVLESSGLREGEEYRLQVNLPGHEVGKKLQPDAIIYLPQGKTVVVDAKMSLSAYSQYCHAATSEAQATALQQHIGALKTHIKQLQRKQYHRIPILKTLEYCLLFVPIEGALTLALQNEPSLLFEAQSNQVMLVSPGTLLIALKTIHGLWRIEQQERHAKHIVQKAANLYDKFRLLIEALQTAKSALDKAQMCYDEAMNRLCLGQGNLLRQVESFQDMGVEVKKRIPKLEESVSIATVAEKTPDLSVEALCENR